MIAFIAISSVSLSFLPNKEKESSPEPLLEVGRPLGVHWHLYGSNLTAVETKLGQLTQPQGPELPGFAWLVGTLPSLEQNAHNKQHRGDKLALSITGFRPCSLWPCYLGPARRQDIMAECVLEQSGLETREM